jgi:hypothetical protein
MKYHVTEFPFEELGRFDALQDALDDGFAESQVWSVVEGDEDNVFVIGPAHHYVNRLHLIATAEHHDGETYYEENWN